MRIGRLALVGLAVAVAVGVGVWRLLSTPATDAEQAAGKQAGEAPAATAPAAGAGALAADERVVHTFKDEQEVQRFVELWQQRHGILVRLSVLQAYLGEEQTGLADLERGLSETYHVDLTALDRTAIDLERRVILERAASATPPAPAPGASPGPAAAPGTAP